MACHYVNLKTTIVHPLHCRENSSVIHSLRTLHMPVESKFIRFNIQNSQSCTEYILMIFKLIKNSFFNGNTT